MAENHVFTREEVFPSWFANRIQDYLSAGKLGFNLALKSASTTVVEVKPLEREGVTGAISKIAAVNIEGRWRFITAPIERAHPGGAAGTYSVWAVAEDNSVNNTPNPFTDHTNYEFELRIIKTGTLPTGVAIATIVGFVQWSGTAITELGQLTDPVTGAQITIGAFSNTGSIEWTREANGALVPTVKAKAITKAMLAEALQEELQAGGVAGHFESHGVALTRVSAAMGAFSTPIKVPIPQVKIGQIVEVFFQGWFKSTIASTSEIAGGSIGLAIAGIANVVSATFFGLGGAELPANTFKGIALGNVTFGPQGTNPPVGRLGAALPSAGLRWVSSVNAAATMVELQGASSSGTITGEDVYLAARVWA